MSLTTRPPAGDAGRVPVASVPAGRPAVDPALRASTPDLAAGAAPEPAPSVRAPQDAAGALRVLVAEVRAAVIDELTAAARLPPPVLADTEPGNAGAALLRWLRSAAAAAGVEPDALRGAFERGFQSALEGLAAAGTLSAVGAGLALAREVVLAGLAGPVARPVPGGTTVAWVPLYRPDVPMPPGARTGEARQRVAGTGNEEHRDASRATEAPGALECGRRFFDALLAGHAELFAECWSYPACAWIGGHWQGFATAQACAREYADLVRALGAAGRLPSRVVALAVEPVGAGVALVRVRLARDASPGAGAGEYPALLTVLSSELGWRVGVWLMP